MMDRGVLYVPIISQFGMVEIVLLAQLILIMILVLKHVQFAQKV